METLEYEMARNLTLLFFLERLMERGEPRTLHDLSCQFGSKGFTKEMRQIAGGSQSGEWNFDKKKKWKIRISRRKLPIHLLIYRIEKIPGAVSINFRHRWWSRARECIRENGQRRCARWRRYSWLYSRVERLFQTQITTVRHRNGGSHQKSTRP